MRKCFYILISLSLLAAVGCGRGVDRRLVLADTLMWTAPDSSLAILNAINRDSLQGDENRAYHALLLTQAQFRCNGNCTTDTLINSALDHYSDNHNREHYTRALLYKGAYYEFHTNQPVEAIKWYKLAEDNADTTDYRNLAQINMRMGTIYYRNYATNGLDTEKFKKAYKYYKIIGDKPMMKAQHSIGNLYRLSKKKVAISLLKNAADIALEINDSNSYYLISSDLSLALFVDSCYKEAKETALKCYDDEKYVNNSMHFNAANAFAMLNKPDSARFFLNKVDTTINNDYDRMMYAFALSRIYRAEGNEILFLKQSKIGNEISNRIERESSSNQIFETEGNVDFSLKNKNKSSLSALRKTVLIVSTVAFLLLLILLGQFLFMRYRHKSIIEEMKRNKELTLELINEYEVRLSANKEQENNNNERNLNNVSDYEKDVIVSYLKEHFLSISRLIESSYTLSHKDFFKEFEHASRHVAQDKYYWKTIRLLADEKSNMLITELENNYPTLTDSEKNVICLVCLGYNNRSIAACTGTSNDSVKSKKTKIKNKIHSSSQLDAFIKQETAKRK